MDVTPRGVYEIESIEELHRIVLTSINIFDSIFNSLNREPGDMVGLSEQQGGACMGSALACHIGRRQKEGV